MRIIKIVFVFVLILAGLCLLISAFIPADFSVERSATVKAPLKTVYYEVKKLSNEFSIKPWSEKDSTLKLEFIGDDGKAGSSYSWTSEEVGEGTMTLTAFSKNLIEYQLIFVKPMKAENAGYFSFEDLGDSCRVSYEVHGHTPFLFRIFNLFMDGSIGPMFERSLQLIKEHCEKIPEMAETEKISVNGTEYLGIRAIINWSDIGKFFGESMVSLAKQMEMDGLEPAGPPRGLFYVWDTANFKTEMVAAMPLTAGPAMGFALDTVNVDGFDILVYPRTLVVNYVGSYDGTGRAHEAIDKWLADEKKRASYPVMEEYVTDPAIEPDTAKWLTKIYYMYD
jgi:effector-binding domain-containing protein